MLTVISNRYTVDHLFDLTVFRYNGSYINDLEDLGENIHFDISDYFVIPEFDIEGVDCSELQISL